MKILSRCQVLSLALLFFPTGRAAAQGAREDYQRAEQFLSGNLRHRIYVAEVAPHWIAKKNRFWYRKAGTKGPEFILVDADQNTTGPAFDHARLAESLSKALKREVQSTELPFDAIEVSDDGKTIAFQVEGAPWSCTVEQYDCKRGPEPISNSPPLGLFRAASSGHHSAPRICDSRRPGSFCPACPVKPSKETCL